MEIVRSSHVQRCCRPLSPEATAGPMSGPWTRGKRSIGAFHEPIGLRVVRRGPRLFYVEDLANLADQGGFKAPPLIGVQANGRAESRKLVANQYVGIFRGRLGARWIRLGPLLEVTANDQNATVTFG
ncbi:hypothetical protein T08_2041 [Trichinella sp. T8]|nr:hypothetical protein T08_2041 [Trichinella sp. T8]